MAWLQYSLGAVGYNGHFSTFAGRAAACWQWRQGRWCAAAGHGLRALPGHGLRRSGSPLAC